MRWILFCLISFNLLYFGWMQYMASSSRQAVPVSAGEEVVGEDSGLVLLKEILPKAGSSVPPPSIDVSSRFATKSVADVISPPGASVADIGSVGSPQSEESVPDEAPISAETEVSVDLLAREPAAGPAEVEPAMERVCVQLGPYDDVEVVNELSRQVVEIGLESAMREESVVAKVDNWVLIPPLGSRKEALKMLRELQGNKIDSYLVTEGEFKNAISLGLFIRPASAQGVLEKMTSAGYEARVEKIERMKTRFWASVWGEFEVGQSQQMLSQLVEDREKIIFSESLCEMFASTP